MRFRANERDCNCSMAILSPEGPCEPFLYARGDPATGASRPRRTTVNPSVTGARAPVRRAANETAAASAKDTAKLGSDARSRLRRIEPRQEVRPEAEILRLREPLVDREAGEPRGDHPGPEGRRPEDVVGVVVRAVQQPVREQHAEQRHEEGAEEQEELLVVGEVEHERAERSDHGRADNEPPLGRVWAHVLRGDRGRVDVRERLVGLVDRQGEQREEARDTAGRDRDQHAVGPSTFGCEGTRIEPKPELEQRRQQVADADAPERGAARGREARVVGNERDPRDAERDHEVDREPERAALPGLPQSVETSPWSRIHQPR